MKGQVHLHKYFVWTNNASVVFLCNLTCSSSAPCVETRHPIWQTQNNSVIYMCYRYSQPPADLWEWYEPYLEDEEVGTNTESGID